LWWIPGALLIGAVLGVVGGAIGQVFRRAGQGEPNWTGVFALVAVAATLLLLIAGGLVTSAREGLAVVDWPNSFGYNMFLYPLSRMTGGIYYEHAHRLFGSLVGLTMLVLAVYLWRTDDRAWVRRFTLVTFAMVCVQGLLGGLRVTGRLTISTSPQDMAPSLALAVALAVFTSRTWQSDRRAETRITAGADRGLSIVLVVLLVVQLVVGAIQRHFLHGLITHITLGVFVVVAVVATGARAWGLYSELSMLRRLGCTLLLLTGVQVILGILALVAISFSPASGAASPIDVAITTVHQAVGAVLLACAVSLMLWYYRLVQPVVAVNATPSSHAVSQ
jgi:cytochrome c oxidase assembly protein subunit 15